MTIVLSGLFGSLGLGSALGNRDIIQAKKLLAQLGIADKIDRPFDLLSKGERQKVLIARALIAEPEILVLDEHGTGLDVLAREQMLQMVQDLANDSNITFIYVTHYVEEILPIFDHCLLMISGEIYAQGATRDLLTDEILSDFLSCPITVSYENQHFRLSMTSPSPKDGANHVPK